MKNRVNERPEGAKFHVFSWQNPEEVLCWLTAVEEEVADLRAAAADRMRKKRDRMLSRHEANRQAKAAARGLDRLFASARASLEPSEGLEPDASEEGEEGEPSQPLGSPTTPAPPPGGEAG